MNKGIVEALLSVGAMEGIGIELDYSDIPEPYINDFNVVANLPTSFIYLNREQMVLWFNKYNEIRSPWPTPKLCKERPILFVN